MIRPRAFSENNSLLTLFGEGYKGLTTPKLKRDRTPTFEDKISLVLERLSPYTEEPATIDLIEEPNNLTSEYVLYNEDELWSSPNLRSFTPSSTKYNNKTKFVIDLTEAYIRNGASPEYARCLVGQDGGETAWGKFVIGDYNFGNIKAFGWKGASKKAYDKREGSYDAYRSYTSLDEYCKDKMALLASRYKMTGKETPELFADKLVKGGYATAKNYKSIVLSWINSI